jgi:peptide/nickel transport system permease protein
MLSYLFVFLATINLIFFLVRLAPGNAAQILLGGMSVGRLPQTEIALLEQRFGLNQGLGVQYVDFLKAIFLTWPPDLGFSFQFFPVSVSALFLQRLPPSILLMTLSLLLAFVISYLLAATSMIRRGGRFDVGVLYSTIVVHSIPIFWTSMILLWIFAVIFPIFPIFGGVSIQANTPISYVLSLLYHAVLPLLAMTFSVFGEMYLLVRGSTQQVLRADYVTAARVRGLKDRIIAQRYILRNSLLPVVSVLAFSFGSLISRLVLVEAVFGYAGVGDLLVDAVVHRDYPVLQGSFFYLVLLVIAAGLIGDLVLVRLDPRLKRS